MVKRSKRTGAAAAHASAAQDLHRDHDPEQQRAIDAAEARAKANQVPRAQERKATGWTTREVGDLENHGGEE